MASEMTLALLARIPEDNSKNEDEDIAEDKETVDEKTTTQIDVKESVSEENMVEPYGCDSCDRTFQTRSRLRIHVKIHKVKLVRIPELRCDECDRVFESRQGYKVHRTKTHERLPETRKRKQEIKGYKCVQCGYTSKSEAAFIIHLEERHNNSPPTKKTKNEDTLVHEIEVNKKKEYVDAKMSIKPDITFLTDTEKDLAELLDTVPSDILNVEQEENKDEVEDVNGDVDEEELNLLQRQLQNIRDPHFIGGTDINDAEPMDELVNQNILESTLKKLKKNETEKLREKISKMEDKIDELEKINTALTKDLANMKSNFEDESLKLLKLQQEKKETKEITEINIDESFPEDPELEEIMKNIIILVENSGNNKNANEDFQNILKRLLNVQKEKAKIRQEISKLSKHNTVIIEENKKIKEENQELKMKIEGIKAPTENGTDTTVETRGYHSHSDSEIPMLINDEDEEEEPFLLTCEECRQDFLSETDLIIHIRNIHNNMNVKPAFICKTCGYKINDKTTLQNHKHTEDASFTCDKCAFQTNNRESLMKHISETHKNTLGILHFSVINVLFKQTIMRH